MRKKKYTIVGDFNIDLNKYNVASNVTNYLNAISSSGCNVFIDKPTRITSNGGSCIDHVYSNFPTNQLDNFILQGDISDHFGTLTRVKNIISKDNNPINYYHRKTNLNDHEWLAFNSDLQEVLKEITPVECQSDPNIIAQSITDCYQKIISKHMPLSSRKNDPLQNKIDKPWMTIGIKNSITQKYKLLDTFRKSKLQSDNKKYKTHLNKLTHIITKAKIKHYRDRSILYGADKAGN